MSLDWCKLVHSELKLMPWTTSLVSLNIFRIHLSIIFHEEVMKPLHEVLSVLAERASDVTREMRIINITRMRNLQPYGDA